MTKFTPEFIVLERKLGKIVPKDMPFEKYSDALDEIERLQQTIKEQQAEIDRLALLWKNSYSI